MILLHWGTSYAGSKPQRILGFFVVFLLLAGYTTAMLLYNGGD